MTPLCSLGVCVEENEFDSGAVVCANAARLKGRRGWQLTLGRGVQGVEGKDEAEELREFLE